MASTLSSDDDPTADDDDDGNASDAVPTRKTRATRGKPHGGKSAKSKGKKKAQRVALSDDDTEMEEPPVQSSERTPKANKESQGTRSKRPLGSSPESGPKKKPRQKQGGVATPTTVEVTSLAEAAAAMNVTALDFDADIPMDDANVRDPILEELLAEGGQNDPDEDKAAAMQNLRSGSRQSSPLMLPPPTQQEEAEHSATYSIPCHQPSSAQSSKDPIFRAGAHGGDLGKTKDGSGKHTVKTYSGKKGKQSRA
ncbi:hypothetical protein EDC04DRAFT_2614442 [Pisolithus marmoratus]|nr:hypothetical protein EDC04DRAFT_2614442 [Pisolithus marmoratus]